MARKTTSNRGDNLSGLLLLDKPQGVTSNGALQEATRLLNARKAGHTGSLDPIATGLLPLCFGSATKLSSLFLGADKTYWTRIRLGERTATGDSEGKILDKKPVIVGRHEIEKALLSFKGGFQQIPPMYSAVKMNGTPLYKLAREGIEIERKPRNVVVHTMVLKSFDGRDLELELKCSHGFYVRGLAHDLGEMLNCGGHVVALRRLVVANLKIEDAVKLTELAAMPDSASRQQWLIPISDGLSHLPDISLSTDAAYYLCRGQAVRADGLPDNGEVRLYAKDVGFLGIGTVTDDGRVAPRRLVPQLGN